MQCEQKPLSKYSKLGDISSIFHYNIVYLSMCAGKRRTSEWEGGRGKDIAQLNKVVIYARCVSWNLVLLLEQQFSSTSPHRNTFTEPGGDVLLFILCVNLRFSDMMHFA